MNGRLVGRRKREAQLVEDKSVEAAEKGFGLREPLPPRGAGGVECGHKSRLFVDLRHGNREAFELLLVDIGLTRWALDGTHPSRITVCLRVEIDKLGEYAPGVEAKPNAVPGKKSWAKFLSVQECLSSSGTTACKEHVAVFKNETLFDSLSGDELMAFGDAEVIKVGDADVLGLLRFARNSPAWRAVIRLTDYKAFKRGSAYAAQPLVAAVDDELRIESL